MRNLGSALQAHRQQILANWLQQLESTAASGTGSLSSEDLAKQADDFLAVLVQAAESQDTSDIRTAGWQDVRKFLDELSHSRLLAGFSADETATFVFSLKRPIFNALRQEFGSDADKLSAESWSATELLDKLGLHAVKTFAMSREAVINRQQTEAERGNLLKEEFLATLSHELRNPLNAILGWATILGRTEGLSAAVMRGVQAIERNSRVQARMITDLLDYAGITSGKVPLVISSVDPYSVVRGALDVAAPSAAARQIELKSSFDHETLVVEADAARLQQVVLNLLTNAIKFSPEKGTVEILASCAGKDFHLSVKDHGKGIHEEFLPRIFERSSQRDSSSTKSYGGLGLGLAIVKQLVDLHVGSIEVASDGEGRGATFTVRIPLSEKLLGAPTSTM